MKKMYTLKKNYEFRKVFNRGKFFGSNTIEAFIIENRKRYNRIGIAISSKLFKATKRNKIKRLIRENYKNNKENMEQGYDIVFLWNKKTTIEEAEYHNIEKSMKKTQCPRQCHWVVSWVCW